ncbi:hypothetical protein FB451DRAFT_1373725 [Mycena latifolia]|nr:hypothetical protein FB451DRAFT_1373725 [Mycena latifolia]
MSGAYSIMPVKLVLLGKVWTSTRVAFVEAGSSVFNVGEMTDVSSSFPDDQTAIFSKGKPVGDCSEIAPETGSFYSARPHAETPPLGISFRTSKFGGWELILTYAILLTDTERNLIHATIVLVFVSTGKIKPSGAATTGYGMTTRHVSNTGEVDGASEGQARRGPRSYYAYRSGQWDPGHALGLVQNNPFLGARARCQDLSMDTTGPE